MSDLIEEAVAEAIEYVRTHRLRDVEQDDGSIRWMSWHGYCESLVSRASRTPFRSSALIASKASRIEGYGVARGPRGSFGFSSGVVIGGIDYGHVWINLGGGLALMASNKVTNRLGGGDAGIVDISQYLARFPAQRVIGWSWDHCGVRMQPKPKPVPPKITPPEEFTMTEAADIKRTLAEIQASLDGGLNVRVRQLLDGNGQYKLIRCSDYAAGPGESYEGKPEIGQQALAAPGSWIVAPSPAYADLYRARGLVGDEISVSWNEFVHLRDFLYLAPEANDEAVKAALTILTETDAVKLTEAIVPEQERVH